MGLLLSCVVPTLDRITVLFKKSLDKFDYEFCIAGGVLGSYVCIVFKARYRFREMCAFSTSSKNSATRIASQAYELHN